MYKYNLPWKSCCSPPSLSVSQPSWTDVWCYCCLYNFRVKGRLCGVELSNWRLNFYDCHFVQLRKEADSDDNGGNSNDDCKTFMGNPISRVEEDSEGFNILISLKLVTKTELKRNYYSFVFRTGNGNCSTQINWFILLFCFSSHKSADKTNLHLSHIHRTAVDVNFF